MAQRRFPIFARLFLLALVCALLPIVGLGLLVLDSGAEALRLSARRLHLAIAGDVRRALRGELDRARAELTAIGQLLLAPGLGDDQRRVDLAGALLTASRNLAHATLYGPDGTRAGTMKAKDAPDEPSSLETAPADLRAAADASPFAASTVSQRYVRVMVAVVVEGKVRGYLESSVDLAPLEALVRELGEQRLGSPEGVVVVDGERRVVVSGDAGETPGASLAGRGIFEHVKGDVSFKNAVGLAPDVEDTLAALETIPELGWAVVVRQPRAVAYAGLAAVRRQIAVAVAVAALAAAALGAWLARRMTRPIASLVDATRDVAARRFTGVAPAALGRGDEIGDLARAFDGMARALGESERRLLEESRRRDTLSRYLSPEVVELVLEDPGRLRLGGERREVTVLFADVCAFTRIAEKLAPEAVVALLNELFTVATEIVHRRGGMVDKFIGDAVMAVWGAPDSKRDDAARAVAAADDLRRWVETANRRWQQKYGVEIALAVGIATGPAIAGNLGSEKRMEYTVIGEAVNTAARLETMAQPRQILVAESTREALGDDTALRPLGERALLAAQDTTRIYEIPE